MNGGDSGVETTSQKIDQDDTPQDIIASTEFTQLLEERDTQAKDSPQRHDDPGTMTNPVNQEDTEKDSPTYETVEELPATQIEPLTKPFLN